MSAAELAKISPGEEAQPPRRRWPLRLVTAVVLAAFGFVLGWATYTIFTPPSEVVTDSEFALVAVEEGEVGSSLSVASKASWMPSSLANNLASGIVTEVAIGPGAEVDVGTVLYTVNLRPVVIAAGDVPAFRDLRWGDHGEDVAQLQRMLKAVGALSGAVDGRFASATSAAVRTWQSGIGMSPDGVVHAGDILFVPELPARVILDPSIIHRGAALGGGEEVLLGLGDSPTFRLAVTDVQAGLLPPGTKVDIASPSGATWQARVSSERSEENGAVEIVLESEGPGPICLDSCADIPVEGDITLSSQAILLETTRGLVVPTAALLSRPDGTTVVIDSNGEAHEVTVLASASGMSVVTGVDEGTLVRAPGAEVQ